MSRDKPIVELNARQRAMIHSATEQQAIREGSIALAEHGPEAAVAVLGRFVGAWERSKPMERTS